MPRVEPGDLPGAGVGGDQLVAAPELLLPVGGPLAVAGAQRLVAHYDPQAGDLRGPTVQVQQPAQVGDERVRHEFAVLVDPGPPGMRPGRTHHAPTRPTASRSGRCDRRVAAAAAGPCARPVARHRRQIPGHRPTKKYPARKRCTCLSSNAVPDKPRSCWSGAPRPRPTPVSDLACPYPMKDGGRAAGGGAVVCRPGKDEEGL